MALNPLEAYEKGDTALQHQLLDEVEPLLFGMVRSLLPGGATETARRHANALTLAFHLDACAGRVAFETPGDLRAYAHRSALARLQDADPILLADLADEKNGSMVYKCLGLQLTLETELTAEEMEAFAARLRGEDVEWPREKLSALGFVELKAES